MVNILVFKIGVACLGIETLYIKTVTKNLEWSTNEEYLNFDDGIVPYNNRKVFIINLEKRFFYKTKISLRGAQKEKIYPFSDKQTEKNCMFDFIVVSFKNNEFMIPIDEVIDIFQISEKDITPIPLFAKKHMHKNFFKGVFRINEKLFLLLDIGHFLNDSVSSLNYEPTEI